MQKNPTHQKNRASDSELITAVNSGRTELFQELVIRYQNALYNFGLRLCGDSLDAEDMVQDAFLNAFKYLSAFRQETAFRNWLYRIATTACIKKRRRSKFAPEHEISLEAFIPETPAEQIPGWASQPLEAILDQELTRTVHQAILSIPEKYRLIVVLRDLEGFSTAETAQILDLTPENVKVRLHRARLFLREKLKEYFSHDK